MRQPMYASLIGCLVLVGATACSGGNSGSSSTVAAVDSSVPISGAPTSPAPSTTLAPTTPAATGVAEVTIEGPITMGNGVVVGSAVFDGSIYRYTESEFFLSGTAHSYLSEEKLGDDGLWTVNENDTAQYKTRLVIRQPVNAADFNGTVVVEWLNVTAGFDNNPDWTFSNIELQRTGAIWVGVSAQRVGIEGGGNKMGEFRSLKIADGVRYGTLNHPGDNYSYDIFSQAGAALWRHGDTLLAGMMPERVIADGESQSASRLVTYINALAIQDDVYSGYLVHSRSSGGAALFRDPVDPAAPPVTTTTTMPGTVAACLISGMQFRGDLRRPILNVSAETDVAGCNRGYRHAEQSDTDWFRSWEIAGSAHADAYTLGIGDIDNGSGNGDVALFKAMLDAPTSAYMGFVTCDLPINSGQHMYVLRSAVASLDQWIRTGVAPKMMPKLDDNVDESSYKLDANGNALGGIRTPAVDVPVAALSGFGQANTGFCGLFGTTKTFTADQLSVLYTDKADFISKWTAATEEAVKTGAILEADMAHIIAAADNYPG